MWPSLFSPRCLNWAEANSQGMPIHVTLYLSMFPISLSKGQGLVLPRQFESLKEITQRKVKRSSKKCWVLILWKGACRYGCNSWNVPQPHSLLPLRLGSPFESTLWVNALTCPSFFSILTDNNLTQHCNLSFAFCPLACLTFTSLMQLVSPLPCLLSSLDWQQCKGNPLRRQGDNLQSVRHLYFASVSLTLYRRLAYLHHQLSSSARVTSVKSQQPLPVTDFQTPCVYLGPIKNIYTWPRSWVR